MYEDLLQKKMSLRFLILVILVGKSWCIKEDIMTIPIGTEYTTGQKCEESGIYATVRHMKPGIPCSATPEEKTIPLAKGDTFPPHKSCNAGVVWKLTKYD